MRRENPILIMFFLLLSSGLLSQELTKDENLRKIILQYGQAEITVVYSSREQANFLSRHLSVSSLKNKEIFITVSSGDLDWLFSHGIEYEIVDVKADKGILTASDVRQAMEWESYPTYTQYDSIMRSFATMYPQLCRLDTIGTSVYNKLVLAVKISDNVTSAEDEPEGFYSSTMHGDETGGFVLMLRFIDYLLKNYSTSARVKALVDNLQIYINPLANPDGTYLNGNIINNPVRNNANGYNLNRTFPDPMDPSIVIPKENIDMIKFLRKHKFVISANFHSGAEVVNYPWDLKLSSFRSSVHADDNWFMNISRAYADTVHFFSGTGYMTDQSNGITRGYDWYEIYGGRQDFVTWQLQGREVTIELDRIKVTPAAQLGLLWNYNRNSLLGYLENALYGIHGLIRDSTDNTPVSARVFIYSHDTDSSHVYSDSLYGSFIRMIDPGSYNILVSADGYKSKIINDVTVFAGQKTDLSVDLQPDTDNIEIPLTDPPVIFPNPTTGHIKIVLPEGLSGNLNVKISSFSGKLMKEFKKLYTQGEQYFIDVSGLASGSYIIVFEEDLTGILSIGKFVLVK